MACTFGCSSQGLSNLTLIDSYLRASNASNSTSNQVVTVEKDTHTVPVVLVVLLTELLIAYTVWSFGHRRTCPWYLQICVTIAWAMPLTVFTLLPLDMASSLYRECVLDDTITKNCDVPFCYVTADVLYVLWRVVYWTAMTFSFIITPLLKGYFLSGEFTLPSKLKDAFLKHVYYFGTLGVLGVLVYLVYGVVFKIWDPRSSLLPIAMSLINAFGLFQIILFLGSGAIQLPRELWYEAYNKRTLRHMQFKAPSAREAFIDAEADLHGAANAVFYVSSRVPETSELRPFVDRLVRKCPVKAKVSGITDEKFPEKIDRAYLVEVHEKLKQAKLQKDRMYAMWRGLIKKSWRFQDIITNRDNADRQFHTTLINKKKIRKWHTQRMVAEWYWYLRIRPYLLRFLCALFAAFSCVIIWSEVTLFVTDSSSKPKLSIFALILDGRKSLSYQAIQFISVCSIAYMIICIYVSLMQMSIFSSRYALLTDHHTDPPSLMFFAAFMSRIAYPLCYNFLTLSGNSNSSVFESFMGGVNMVKIFGERFNLYVPILMSVVCFATLFNLTGKVLSVFGFENVFNERSKQNDLVVSEGRVIIDQARRIEEQNIQKDGFQGEKQLFALGEEAASHLANENSQAQKTAQLLNSYKSGNRGGAATAEPSSQPAAASGSKANGKKWWTSPFSKEASSVGKDSRQSNAWEKIPDEDPSQPSIPLGNWQEQRSLNPAPKAAKYMFDDD